MITADEAGFRRALSEFNDRRFFECHDTLEELWRESSGEEKRFLQGLIQISVGFYHFFNGNPSGALSQWMKGSGKLEGLGPVYAGIDLDGLLGSVRLWSGAAAAALAGGGLSAEGLQIPMLKLNNNTHRR